MCVDEGPSEVHVKCFGPKEGGMDFLGVVLKGMVKL